MLKKIILIISYTCLIKAESPFITESNSAIQGILYHHNSWFFTQAHNKNSINFSIFDNSLNLKKTISLKYPSHGQDLSYVKIDKKEYLLTSGKHMKNIALYSLIKSEKQYDVVYKKELKLEIGKNTPTMSENGKYLLTIANKSVYIYDFKTLSSKYKVLPIYSFILNKVQRKKTQWKQGIVMRDNNIYILTGDKNIQNPKYLFIYDAYGKVLKKIKLKLDINIAKKEGNKLEVEGLAFKNNELYTTVMTGHNGKNKKRLLKIYEENSR